MIEFLERLKQTMKIQQRLPFAIAGKLRDTQDRAGLLALLREKFA